MRKTRRRSQKSRSDSSFQFEKLENRQLMAADVAMIGCGSLADSTHAETVQVGQQETANHDIENRVERIVNGTQTDGYEAVGIVNNGCTGTLIAPNAVLTAAHCVEDGGRHTFEVNGKTYTSTNVTIHPDYGSRDVDLAVMILNENVEGVKPYEL